MQFSFPRLSSSSTYYFLLYTVFFVSLISSHSALAKQLIVSVAPSYPVPVSLLSTEVNTPSTKKLKLQKTEKAVTHHQTKEKLPGKNEIWQDVFSYISTEAGIELIFEPASSQLDFEINLAKSYYDLALVTPLQFEAFRQFPGYQAQVKRKAQPIRAIIFVKKSSNISSFSALRDANIAFPNPLNFESSVAPRESLKRLNFNISPQFLASESAVYQAVMKEQYIAGSGTHENFLAQPVEIRNSLKIIWDSPGFTPHAFVAHPRVSFFSLVKLKRAFVNMIKDEEAKKLLPYIFVDNGFEVARDSDWDEIKLIDLKELNGNIKNTQAK